MAGNDWMAGITDRMPVADLVIPGTHDSGTYTYLAQLVPYALTQTLGSSIYDQLTAGVRALDIRLKQIGSDLVVVHGEILTGISFDKVRQDLARFLAENPSETVIATLKFDGSQWPLFSGKTGGQLLQAALRDKGFADFLVGYGNGQTASEIDYASLALGDVRGRVLIVDRTGNKLGLDASYWLDNQTFVGPGGKYAAQDLYSSPPMAAKIDAINDFIVQDHPGLNFNFTSAATSSSNLLVGPKDYAGVINPYLASQLDGSASGIIASAATSGALRGVFFTDFAQADKMAYAAYNNGSDWLASSKLSSWLPELFYRANQSVSLSVRQDARAAESGAGMIAAQPLTMAPVAQVRSTFSDLHSFVKLGSAFDIVLSATGYEQDQKIYFSVSPGVGNTVTSVETATGSFVVGSQQTLRERIDFAGELRGIDKFSLQLYLDEARSVTLGAPFDFYAVDPQEDRLAGAGASDPEFLSGLYADILRRAPDADGLSYWLRELGNGIDRKDVIVSFLVSPEYASETRDDRLFIKELFADLLDKPADGADLVYWENMLAGGAPRAAVAKAMVESPEFQKLFYLGSDHPDHATNLVYLSVAPPAEFVASLYTTILHRVPDTAGLDYWIGKLTEGASRSEIATRFFCSDEFRSGAPDATTFIESLYQIIFNRPPEGAGGAYWIQQVEGGTPRQQVVQAFLHSNEFKVLLGLSPSAEIPLLDASPAPRLVGIADASADLQHG